MNRYTPCLTSETFDDAADGTERDADAMGDGMEVRRKLCSSHYEYFIIAVDTLIFISKDKKRLSTMSRVEQKIA